MRPSVEPQEEQVRLLLFAQPNHSFVPKTASRLCAKVKSRRTSAGPSNGQARSRVRRAAPEPEIVEDSEYDSEEEVRPTRPVRKTAKGVRS